MARTYPAKRSYIAKGFGFPGCDNWSGPSHACSCETWSPALCDECGEEIEDGQRIVLSSRWIEHHEYSEDTLMHARCADAGEALP